MNLLGFIEGLVYYFFVGNQLAINPTPHKVVEVTNRQSGNVLAMNPKPKVEVSNRELAEIATQLYAADTHGAGKTIKLNLQGHTNFGNTSDKAPAPLFSSVPWEVLRGPTYTAFMKLLDNYEVSPQYKEVITEAEIREEEEFIREIFKTEVISKMHAFLTEKGYADGDISKFRNYFRQIWFGMYPRAGSVEGSSGFEHVFLGELKNGIGGFHSWIRFLKEEQSGSLDYLGFIHSTDIGSNKLVKMPMKWKGQFKPFNSILIGSSPELELALYTICYLTRSDKLCSVEINGKPLRIQTHDINYNGKHYVGTAYPSN